MFQISCESRFICRLCLANVILQGSPGPSSDVAHPVLAIGDTTIDPPAEETVPVDEIVATGPPPASESETHRFMSAQKAKGELFHSHNQSLNPPRRILDRTAVDPSNPAEVLPSVIPSPSAISVDAPHDDNYHPGHQSSLIFVTGERRPVGGLSLTSLGLAEISLRVH